MLKINYLLLCLILTGTSLLAQDGIRKKQFFIGAFVSPDVSYRILQGSSSGSGAIAENRNSYEIPKFAYTLGTEALYQISQRLSISMGIQYSVKGEKTKDLDLVYGDQIDPRRGFIIEYPTGQPTKVNFNYNTKYIDIPLRIDFYLSKKKIAPFITTGISTNIFLREKIQNTDIFADGHKEKTVSKGGTTYYSVNPQYQIGAGVDMTFKKSRLRIFPIYRISLAKVNSGPVNGYFNSIGLGINYFFGL